MLCPATYGAATRAHKAAVAARGPPSVTIAQSAGNTAADCWKKSGGVKLPEQRWACIEWLFDAPNAELRYWLDGRPIDGLTAVVHSVLFWAGNVILSPLVLLVTLFSDRKRTLHDLLLGTVVSRTDR